MRIMIEDAGRKYVAFHVDGFTENDGKGTIKLHVSDPTLVFREAPPDEATKIWNERNVYMNAIRHIAQICKDAMTETGTDKTSEAKA